MGNSEEVFNTCVRVSGKQSSGKNYCRHLVSEAAAVEKQHAGCISEPGQ